MSPAPADDRDGRDAGDGSERPVIRDRRRVRADADTPRPLSDLARENGPADQSGSGNQTDPREQESSTVQHEHPAHRADATAAGPAAGPTGGPTADGVQDALLAQVDQLTAALAERTGDLQRLSAEYANYRRRVDRDRETARVQATGTAAGALIPVLDDIDRAREHEELSPGFRSVADALQSAVTGLGLVRYGAPGDRFDPTLHEALMHAYGAGVDGATCTTVFQAGYRVGDRVVRPARVMVTEPGPGTGDTVDTAPAAGAGDSAETPDAAADAPPEGRGGADQR